MNDNDRSLPATRGDVEDLKEELKGDIDGLKGMIRESQTEVLRAFYSFSKSLEARLRMQDATNNGVGERLNALESRMTEVERKLNLPN